MIIKILELGKFKNLLKNILKYKLLIISLFISTIIDFLKKLNIKKIKINIKVILKLNLNFSFEAILVM